LFYHANLRNFHVSTCAYHAQKQERDIKIAACLHNWVKITTFADRFYILNGKARPASKPLAWLAAATLLV
jgi:hypothetical protein